jgi:hypothetical protein
LLRRKENKPPEPDSDVVRDRGAAGPRDGDGGTTGCSGDAAVAAAGVKGLSDTAAAPIALGGATAAVSGELPAAKAEAALERSADASGDEGPERGDIASPDERGLSWLATSRGATARPEYGARKPSLVLCADCGVEGGVRGESWVE